MEKNYRPSLFIVVYRKNSNIRYLLLKRKLHWTGWEFPKGGKEKGETIKQTITREVKEETGLLPLKIKKHNESGSFNYDSRTIEERGFFGQRFELYSVEIPRGKIQIDSLEHSTYCWVDFEKAMQLLTWDNQKKCLEKVNSWLSQQQP